MPRYELMLKSATGIKESPKKMNVSALMQDMAVNTPTTIELDKVSQMDLFQKVTVDVKVLDVKDTETVGHYRDYMQYKESSSYLPAGTSVIRLHYYTPHGS